MNTIKITCFEDMHDCEYCGYTLSDSVEIESDLDSVPSTFLGEANCFSSSSAYFLDGLNYIFEKLGKSMPYTRLTQKALEEVGDNDPSELYKEGKISYKVLRRALEKRLNVPYGEELLDLATVWCAEQDIFLVVVKEEYFEDESTEFSEMCSDCQGCLCAEDCSDYQECSCCGECFVE